MECEMIEELTIRYLEKDLDISDKCELENHISSCKKCKIKFSRIKEVYDPSLIVTPPANLKSSIMKRIDSLEGTKKLYLDVRRINSKKENTSLNRSSQISTKRRIDLIPMITGAVEMLLVILVLTLVPYYITKNNNHSSITNMQQSTGEHTSKTLSVTIILKDNWPPKDGKDILLTTSMLVTPMDINNVINIFRSEGSNDISVNGIQISKNTEVLAYGNFIQIEDNKLLKSPFTIKSTGVNSNAISEINDGNTIKDLKSRGVLVKIETQEEAAEKNMEISQEAESTIKKVANIYGEQNPQIKEITTTEEETTKRPMYIVFLEGNFQKGEQKSKKLKFSMTEDGTRVWALTSDNWQVNEVNLSK